MSRKYSRSALTIVAGVCFTALVYLSSPYSPPPPPAFFRSGPGPHRPWGLGFGFGEGGSRGPSLLKRWLWEEDERYQESVRERQELIEKWGPGEGQVDPFPSHGEFYTLWDYFIPSFQCPHRVERIGMRGDGGKWVCGMDRVAEQQECVIYSFGINGESSFEAALLERAPGCQVWGYDFSVNEFGPEIELIPSLQKRSHFLSAGLAGEDKASEYDNPKFYTLQSLMEMNNHTFIDILKIDIEGAEFEALAALVKAYATAPPPPPPHPFPPSNPPDSSDLDHHHHPHDASFPPPPPPLTVLPFGQLQIEIHARHGHEKFAEFARWWKDLEEAGLRPFWTEPNLVYVNLVRGVGPELAEYSFMNIRGEHALVSDFY
ncbi:uncharacterized protein STEHIDRAFT_172201 [Stereum hirsutum FP-91666 SS1]|uniref:uncharacterized protein n=1 Tax=Stereum hirsutum (strain FP-91666) TaxID=721885 RepID=UPI000444A84E|nr:uncharacterized protein STEHIDRAFT_172201 [Stereum hirsutum FP-91666 SS1]EIM81205.1 hypothetical protein STEHIDRAFT_172201 [Stereum hirsutum FP-91666 SS1]